MEAEPLFKHIRKTTIRNYQLHVCLFVRPSVWNNWAPTARIFMKFFIFQYFFRKSVEKVKILLKSENNNRYSTSVFLNLCETAAR